MVQPPEHFWNFMEDGDFDKFAQAERQIPYPTPESVIADVIAKAQGHEKTTGAARRMAHKATTALRNAGWRILR